MNFEIPSAPSGFRLQPVRRIPGSEKPRTSFGRHSFGFMGLVLLFWMGMIGGDIPAAAGEVNTPALAGISAEERQALSGTSGVVAEPEDIRSGEEGDEDFDDEDLDFLDEEELDDPAASVPDPLEPWNRAMFHFNDRLYFWLLKPVCRGYNYLLPVFARTGIKHFFVNAAAPIRIFNCLLQGRVMDAEAEWARFLMNSTVGAAGFGNPAETIPDLYRRDEDLGQSLGAFGIGDGFYLIWPVIGPSTLRDSLGDIGDGFLNPRFYLNPFLLSAGLWSLEKVNDTSFRLGDYETLMEAAMEPYDALRDGYIQSRMKKIAE
ncbi:MAG: MlaA family lipoprotein [Thermodesulfobacteriota bacterium]